MESNTASDKTLLGAGPCDPSDMLELPNAEELMEVLGKEELGYLFNEYVELHPSLDPIKAGYLLARIYTMLSWPEPTFDTLLKWSRNLPTEEPWAEALFCGRVKLYLESSRCAAVVWKPIDYSTLPTKEERLNARIINLKRYRFVLKVLERLQEDRGRKALANTN